MRARHEHQRRNDQAEARRLGPAQTDRQAAKRRANQPRREGVREEDDRTASPSSCRAISPTAEDTPLTTIAPASARSSQAMADAASPKRAATTQRPMPRRQSFQRFQTLRGFVEPDAIQAQFVDDMQGARTDCDVDAKLRRPCVETAPICQGERDLAIPHDRLHVDTEVPCDPIDAALETLRTDVVFEQEARAQLKEAQRRLAGCRGVPRQIGKVWFGGHRVTRLFRERTAS